MVCYLLCAQSNNACCYMYVIKLMLAFTEQIVCCPEPQGERAGVSFALFFSPSLIPTCVESGSAVSFSLEAIWRWAEGTELKVSLRRRHTVQTENNASISCSLFTMRRTPGIWWHML